MNINQAINSKIKLLMEQNQVSLRKLGEVIGVSHPTMSKYIENNQPIDSDKLMKIAQYFNKSFDYFFNDSNEEFNFMFRADKPDKNITNIDIDHMNTAILSYLDILGQNQLHYIPQKYTMLEQLSKNELESFIEKIAIEQRKLAKIEDIIPDNYFEVIEKIGVNVISRDFHNDHYFGVSSFSNSCGSFILINDSSQISEERKLFSLIHEYAHLLFHSNQYSSVEYNAFYVNNNKDFHEQVANSFAGYFLMPRNLVDSYVNSLSSLDVFDMKKHFQVSIQTVYMMLYKYQMISKEVFQKFWAVINSNGWKKQEPDPIESIQPEHKNTRIIRHIKDLYMKDEITANKISEVLGLDALQIRQLLKDWRSKDERFIPLR